MNAERLKEYPTLNRIGVAGKILGALGAGTAVVSMIKFENNAGGILSGFVLAALGATMMHFEEINRPENPN